MRYAWVECKNDDNAPLPLYVSFNKYFKLEPLLKNKPNAIDLFHKWVLAKILLSAYEIACDIEDSEYLDLSTILIADKEFLINLIVRLEQGLSPSLEQENIVQLISVSSVISSRNNRAILHDHAPDRHLIQGICFFRLADGCLHIFFVLRHFHFSVFLFWYSVYNDTLFIASLP